MGIMDIIKGEQTISNYITGRNAKDSSMYVELDKSAEAINTLYQIANKIPSLESSVEAAYNTLSSATGMSMIAPGGLPFQNPSSLFDSASSNIQEIASKIESSRNDYIYYSSSTGEKILSTAVMNGVSLVDKTLSIFEKMGDNAISVWGWGASKAVGIFNKEKGESIKNSLTEFANKNLVHDGLLGKVYNSDFAKKSIFTENSALAGAHLLTSGAGKEITSAVNTTVAAAGILTVGNKLVNELNKSQSELETMRALNVSPKDGVKLELPTEEAQGKPKAVIHLNNETGTTSTSSDKHLSSVPVEKTSSKTEEEITGEVSVPQRESVADKLSISEETEKKEEENDKKSKVEEVVVSKEKEENPTKENPTKEIPTKENPTTIQANNEQNNTTSKEINNNDVEPEETYTYTSGGSTGSQTSSGGSSTGSQTSSGGGATQTNSTPKKTSTTKKAEESHYKEEYYKEDNDDVSTNISAPTKTTTSPTVSQSNTIDNKEEQRETAKETAKEISKEVEKPTEEIKTSVITSEEVSSRPSSLRNDISFSNNDHSENSQTIEEELPSEKTDSILNTSTSIEEAVQGTIVKKIPTSKPIIKEETKSNGNLVIPIGAGLSTAAAAGLGAKAYLDKKAGITDEEEFNESDDETIEIPDESKPKEIDINDPTANFMKEIGKEDLIEIL